MNKAIAIVLPALIIIRFSMSLAHTTTATFYTPPYVPSACNGFKGMGTNIGAASMAIWDNGAACGRKYRVKCKGPTNDGVLHPCTGETAIITIADLCPPGSCHGTIDLSQEIFKQIANPAAGIINIELIQI